MKLEVEEIRISISEFDLKNPNLNKKTVFSRCYLLAGCSKNKRLAVSQENEIRRDCGIFSK